MKSTTNATQISRRKALKGFGFLMVGMTLGCQPARIGLGIYPKEYKESRQMVDRTLGAFMETIVPGISKSSLPGIPRNPQLTNVFHDKYYRLDKYSGFLASDLSRRARRMYGNQYFDQLSYDQRTAVIQDALDSGGVNTKLYTGAIYLTQVAVYSGVCNGDKGCDLIDFSGKYQYQNTSYPIPEKYLARSITKSGNID